MKFGDIFAVLVVLLVLYYVAMIALDIYKENLKKQSEKEKEPEVDIDISDEAGTFTPIQVRRDDIKPMTQPKTQPENTDMTDSKAQESESDKVKPDETKVTSENIDQPASPEQKDKPSDSEKPNDAYDPKSWEIPQSVIDEHRGKSTDDSPESGGQNSVHAEKTDETSYDGPILNVRKTYREPCMSNGMPVENLVQFTNEVSNDGTADLQNIVMKCDAA